MKKPPDLTKLDPYKTLKVPLNAILKKNNKLFITEKINNAVYICNDLVIRIYEFINLFIFYQLENNKPVPKFTKDVIIRITSLIGLKDNRGRKSKIIEDDLYIFSETIFKPIYQDLLKLNNLSYIIPLLAEDIIKTLETNLKTHFPKYLRKLVNTTFIGPYKENLKNKEIPYSEEEKLIMYEYLKNKHGKDEIKYKHHKSILDLRIQNKNITREYRKVLYKILKSELDSVKNDLFNSKVEKSNSKYHVFINKYISLYPKLDFKKSKTKTKTKTNTKNKKETNKCLLIYDVKVNPQKYINLAISINKSITVTGSKCYQVIPQRSSLVPRHIILNTSGLTEVINDKNKKVFDFGYTEMIHNTKEYQDYLWKTILVHNFNKKYKSKNYKFYNQISTDGFSASLLFIRTDLYNKEYGAKIDDPKEFCLRYIDDLTDKELSKLKDKTFLGYDPGQLSPVTMTDGSTFYEFSNVRRRDETYTKKSKKILNEEKSKTNVITLETDLSSQCLQNNFNKRSLEFTKYKNYIETKNVYHNEEMTNFYKDIKWRKFGFRRYSRTKKSENNLLAEIVKKYGSNIVIGLGDYSVHSSKQIKGTIPVPSKSIYKLLTRRFKHVYLIDEFRTSLIYNRDHSKELKNLKINKKSKHRLLTPKENPKGVIVNRDHNASVNILEILKEYIFHKKRPEAFKRSLRKVNLCL